MSLSPHPGGGSGAGVAPSPHPNHDDRNPPPPAPRTPQVAPPPGGTPGGRAIRVPLDKITSAAQVLESLGISAEQIAYGLKAADPPAGLWGVLGLLMKGAYDAKAEETREHIRTISTVLNAKGGAIRETANRYQKVDEEAQRAFQRFLDTMGGGQ